MARSRDQLADDVAGATDEKVGDHFGGERIRPQHRIVVAQDGHFHDSTSAELVLHG